jgi:hypothetical protein
MDMNGYALETIVRDYLAQRRAEASRIHLMREVSRRGSLRSALGRTLIRLGHRLAGGLDTAGATA